MQYYQAKSEDTETEYKLAMSKTISLFRKMASTRCHSDAHGTHMLFLYSGDLICIKDYYPMFLENWKLF
jgi:hypothetical protein